MTSSASLPSGSYRLEMPIDGLTGLTEFSELQYSLRSTGSEDPQRPIAQAGTVPIPAVVVHTSQSSRLR
jgi:hypothetical protein